MTNYENCYNYDSDTNELEFTGNHIKAVFDENWDEDWDGERDGNHKCVFFRADYGYSVEYHLNRLQFGSICEAIEENPENFSLRYFDFSREEGFLYENTAEGLKYLEVNGDWVIEDEPNKDLVDIKDFAE